MMTPWFDKYTRPHWIGFYETRYDITEKGHAFNYWNGRYWEITRKIPLRHPMCRDSSYIQHIEWRGFTKEQT